MSEVEELKARIRELEGERDAIHEQLREILHEQECACGYDSPTDVCLGHLPLHRKTVARAEAAEATVATLTAQVEAMRGALGHIESMSPHSGGEIHGMTLERWRDAFNELQEIARAAYRGEKP